MSIYSNLGKTASNMLTKFGQTCVHTIKTDGTYDRNTGTRTITETTQNIKAALFAYSKYELDGISILATDSKLIVSSIDITKPKVNDTVNANGIDWTIKRVSEVSPANSTVIYICQVRR